MAALSATEIENPVVGLKPCALYEKIDLLLGVAVILDNVAVGFEIKRVEQRSPPFGGQMALEIGHRSKGSRRRGFGGRPFGRRQTRRSRRSSRDRSSIRLTRTFRHRLGLSNCEAC